MRASKCIKWLEHYKKNKKKVTLGEYKHPFYKYMVHIVDNRDGTYLGISTTNKLIQCPTDWAKQIFEMEKNYAEKRNQNKKNY